MKSSILYVINPIIQNYDYMTNVLQVLKSKMPKTYKSKKLNTANSILVASSELNEVTKLGY